MLDHGRTLISLRKQCKVHFPQCLSSKTSISGQNRLDVDFTLRLDGKAVDLT